MYTLVEVALSVGVLVSLITALSVCVCGCKDSNQKSELVGTAGVVKLRFDEEAPSPTPTTPASIKRASTQNSQRSLPEIPHPVGGNDSGGDTTSEIYATVNLDEGSKVEAAASTSRDHPYEHAYAKLQNESHNITVEITPDQTSDNDIQIDEREAGQSGAEFVVISASVAISGQLPSSQELPYITPPSPRPNTDTVAHFSGDSTDSAKGYTSISVREPLSNIRAQSIKPPNQPHYATVSDDSDEMYAAIEEASVGEGSDTYAQIAPEPRRRDHTPIHPDTAARRSAPPEVGTSTSHQATHSRQASSSSCSNSTGALGSPKPEKRQANSPLPPPPAHPAHSTHTQHSGNASHSVYASHSGNATHSVYASHSGHPTHSSHAAPPPVQRSVEQVLANKHQRINSTGDLQFNHDKLRRSLNEKHQRNNSCVSSSDFYGCNYPVEKHRFSSGELVRPLPPAEGPSGSAVPPGGPPAPTGEGSEPPGRAIDDMYAKVVKRARTHNNTQHPGHGYETIAHLRLSQDPGYETVKHKPNSFANNNLKLNQTDSGPSSMVGSDPGYEHIAKNDAPASDTEPNYEVLRNQPPTPPYATIAPNYKVQPTYSTVNKRPNKYNNWPANNNEEPALEPNYESMPHDPLYTTGSESDPNYESVRPKDPNYESVNAQDPNYESLRCRDPKYESVRSKDSKYDSVRSKKDPNYESVKYFELAKKEPSYEKVNSAEATASGIERSDSSAGYERINVPNNRDTKNSINNGVDATVSDYFHV